MIDVKNIKEVFVLKDCARTPKVQIWDSDDTTTYLGNGECVITDPQGNVLNSKNAVKAVDRIMFHFRSHVGDDMMRSVEIPGSAITDFVCEKYTPASEQLSCYGYNGSKGDANINLAANTLYWVKLVSKNNNGMRNVDTFAWKSGSIIPTKADVLLGIAKAINTKKAVDKTFKVEATVVQTGSTTSTISVKGKVIKGDKNVLLSGSTMDISVGDVILVGTVPCKVEEVLSSTRIKLEFPYHGASKDSVTLAKVTDASVGKWGIILVGLPYKYEAGKYSYKMCKFEIGALSRDFLGNFSTLFEADRGVGTYKQVYDLEWYTKSFQGNNVKTHALYPVDYKYETPLGVDGDKGTYNLVTIVWENKETKNIDGNTIQSGNITLAIPVGARQGHGGFSTIAEVLNKYIVTEWGIGKAITLT